MIKQITLLSAIVSLFFCGLIAKPAQALSCAPTSTEQAIAQAGTILQARITAVVYADGTSYTGADYREDPVYLRAEVSRIWRGRASGIELFVFADPEWGGVPATDQDYIFYLSRRDGLLSTGNCIRLSSVNGAEIQLIEGVVGEATAPIPGEASAVATYFPLETVDNDMLLPIAIGPGSAQLTSVTSAGALPFNLLCLLLLVLAVLGGRLIQNSRYRQKEANPDPVKP